MHYSDTLKNEAKISAADLIEELSMLFNGDFYEGEIHYKDSVITYFMPNGQVFKISVTEV